MEIVRENKNGYAVLMLSGRLDGVTVTTLETAIDKVDADAGIVFDLANLGYISSIGLRVIIMTAKKMQAAQKRFLVCGLRSPVREVFQISGFYNILQIRDTSDDATRE
jgi:anti-anti-sigma factor